jgi:hypothetical protein
MMILCHVECFLKRVFQDTSRKASESALAGQRKANGGFGNAAIGSIYYALSLSHELKKGIMAGDVVWQD